MLATNGHRDPRTEALHARDIIGLLRRPAALGLDDDRRVCGVAGRRALGASGAGRHRAQQLARGIDPRPLVPDPDVPRFLERLELEWPIDELEPLSFVLARLLDPLSSSLERADRGAVAIRLDLRLVDRITHTRVLPLPVAMRDPRVLRTLILLDLESHPPPAAIDIVTIELDPAPGRVISYSLLERPQPSAETLATLTARLGALVGDSRCGAPVLLDSHGPDAFEMRRFTDRGLPILTHVKPHPINNRQSSIQSAILNHQSAMSCVVSARRSPCG
jgi:hypothetical protein